MSYYIGADLGQQNDFTALSVIREMEVPTGEIETYIDHNTWTQYGYVQKTRQKTTTEYHVRYMKRYLGESYTVVADRIAELAERPELQRPAVVIDATGCGRPVVDMIRDRGVENLVAVTITGGNEVTNDGDEYRVPKRDLVATVQVLLQNRRLRMANALELKDAFVREMQNFKIKLSADGHDSYEHWRDSDHDDLVLSVAMALWWAKSGKPQPFKVWDI